MTWTVRWSNIGSMSSAHSHAAALAAATDHRDRRAASRAVREERDFEAMLRCANAGMRADERARIAAEKRERGRAPPRDADAEAALWAELTAGMPAPGSVLFEADEDETEDANCDDFTRCWAETVVQRHRDARSLAVVREAEVADALDPGTEPADARAAEAETAARTTLRTVASATRAHAGTIHICISPRLTRAGRAAAATRGSRALI